MRSSATGLALALLFASGSASATTFDAATGAVSFEPTAIFKQSFEDNASFGTLPVARFTTTFSGGYVNFTADAAAFPANAFTGEGIEGAHALRVGVHEAVLLGSKDSLAALAAGRVEVTFFAKADGARPEVRVIYDSRALEDRALAFPFSVVAAVRTGRATSDGWVEYSTGPIDGTIRTRPITGILLLSEETRSADDGGYFVDALEVKQVSPTPVTGAVCHIATEATDCAAGTACVEGKCTDSAVVYGALPPKEHRRAFVSRQATYFARMQADRHASAAAEGFSTTLTPATDDAKTAEAFYRPFIEESVTIRGGHTTQAAPRQYATMSAGSSRFLRYQGNELHACFGLIDKDMLGGGRAYGVYSVVAGSALHVGDVLQTIDGEPAQTWLDRVAKRAGLISADPDADGALAAEQVVEVVMHYARNITVVRCTVAGACAGADAVTIPIDIEAARQTGNLVPLTCGPRFQRGVTVPNGVDPDAYEAAISETSNGVTTVYTNGEPPVTGTAWMNAIEGAFKAAPAKMIVDKRRGDGGGGDALWVWQAHVRQDEQFGLFWMGRGRYDAIDGDSSLLASLLDVCTTWDAQSAPCSAYASRWERIAPATPARPSKIAWLNVVDGSASDMATAYAKGVAGVRIFAPNRTLGLFGGLSVMPSFFPGWIGGSIQGGDTRVGSTKAEVLQQPWHSGRGIDPDEVIVQKQSDLLKNVDTMLTRARAWLAQ